MDDRTWMKEGALLRGEITRDKRDKTNINEAAERLFIKVKPAKILFMY